MLNDIQLTRNFKLSEFKDNEGNFKLNMDLVHKLQHLRDLIKVPIIITSGYRNPEYNRKIGGAENSQHLLGNAVDIQVNGFTIQEIYFLANLIGFNGIGLYDNFIHLDVRETKTHWDNRK